MTSRQTNAAIQDMIILRNAGAQITRCEKRWTDLKHHIDSLVANYPGSPILIELKQHMENLERNS